MREIKSIERRIAKEKKEYEKAKKENIKKTGLNKAEYETNKSIKQHLQINNLLRNYNFELVELSELKKIEKFKKTKPPSRDKLKKKVPEKPTFSNFKIPISTIDKIFTKRKIKKEKIALKSYEKGVGEWKKTKKQIESHNTKIENEDKEKLKNWQRDKEEFNLNKLKFNNEIDRLTKAYANSNPEGVSFFSDSVISKLKLPFEYNPKSESNFDLESKILVIDIELPDKRVINKLKKMRYFVTKNEYSKTYLKEKEINNLYDAIITQLCLIVQNSIYLSDKENIIESIVFNGWSNVINPSTGKINNSCIISMQSTKIEFLDLNISAVDPTACFKSFKGIAGNKLSDLIPIAPILQISDNDNRFVESIEINNDMIDGNNLAEMHWEEFEHLIRDLFEKEFKNEGGEVRVTQASRDGGVDAIAFDPDPIKGGKIVIQAKRYTNVVGVSAVRDLYGTVLNEGANKGILVTTSNYGSDSFKFARDKPLTLLNGANLLHLLNKHGYKSRIDIKEARDNLNKRI